MSANQTSAETPALTVEARADLDTASRWARFLAIVSLCGAALCALAVAGAVGWLGRIAPLNPGDADEKAAAAAQASKTAMLAVTPVLGVGLLVCAAVTFLLFGYGRKLVAFRDGRVEALAGAFGNLRILWILGGFSTAFWVLVAIALMIANLTGLMPAPKR